MERGSLEGKTILVVEREPLIALDLQRALEAAGAEVVVTGNAKDAVSRIRKSRFAAGVIDWHPSCEDHRLVARALKQGNVRFLFYATHSPKGHRSVGRSPNLPQTRPCGGHRAGVGDADWRLLTAKALGSGLLRMTGVFLNTRTQAACTGDYGATPERAVDFLGSGRALASNCVSGSEAGRAFSPKPSQDGGAVPACSWRACSQRARPRHRMACLRRRSPPPGEQRLLRAGGATRRGRAIRRRSPPPLRRHWRAQRPP